MKVLFQKPPLILCLSFFVILLIFSPYFLGGKIIRGDQSDLFIPYLTFLKSAFQSGDSPFWSPYNAGGFPAFVSQPYPFFPLHALLLFLSPVAAHHISLFLVLSLALFFAVLFIQELDAGIVAAWVGGVSYLISQIVYENNSVTAIAVLFQAFFFWGIIKFIKADSSRRRWLYGGLLSLGVFLGWLGGSSNYQFVTYTIIGGFAFALFMAWKMKQKLWKIAGYFILICGIGTVLGSLQLIPAFAVTQYSIRAGGISFTEAASAEPVTFSDLLLFIDPFWPRSSEAFLYMGLLPLLFFIGSFFFRNSYIKFFGCVFIVVLFIAFNGSPLFWLLQHLPVLRYFRYPSRFMILGSFAGSVLAGLGLAQIWPKLEARFQQLKDPKARSWALGLLIGLTVLDYKLAVIGKFGPVTVAPSIFTDNSATKTLQATAKDGRILFVLPENTMSVFYYSLLNQAPPDDIRSVSASEIDTLKPNINLWYGLQSIEFLDPLLPRNMGRFMALLGSRQLGEYGEKKLHKFNVPEMEKILMLKDREGLLNFLGVRYLLSAFNLSAAGFNFPVVGVMSIPELTAGNHQLSFGIYENPNAKRMAYFSPITKFVKDDEEGYQSFKAADFHGVFVTCAECAQKIVRSDGAVKINSQKNSGVAVSTNSSGQQFLVFSQNFLPGWKALIDGKETPMYRVNSVFGGIFVPEGKHEIKFEFRYFDMFKQIL